MTGLETPFVDRVDRLYTKILLYIRGWREMA